MPRLYATAETCASSDPGSAWGASTLLLSGQATIRSDRSAVWAALHDVDILKACVPGCLSLVRTSPGIFEVSARAPGPIALVLDGRVEIADSDEPRFLLLKAESRGASFLMLSGSMRISLASCAAGCQAAYEVKVKPTGLVAAMSTPFVMPLGWGLMDRFILAFAARVGQRPPARSRREPP